MAMEDLVHTANGPRFSFAEEMIPILETVVRVCAREGARMKTRMNAMFVRCDPRKPYFWSV